MLGGKVALPSCTVFPGSIYMPGWVTLGRGSPSLLGRVTLLGGLTFYHVKGRGRVTLLISFDYRITVAFAVPFLNVASRGYAS